MRSIDRAKYDIGQKVYAYEVNEIIECSIYRISIDENGVVYGTERKKTVPGMFSMETHEDYYDYPQDQLFAKKSEALAYAIEFKSKLLQDKIGIRLLDIYKLKKELEEELEKENANEKTKV